MRKLMPSKLNTTISIHNFRLKIIANDKDIFRLVIEQLNFPRLGQRQKAEFEVIFNLKKIDYRLIPQTKSDIFIQYPLFQNEYLENGKFFLNAGLRTIRISIEPKKNLVDVYVASGQDIDKDLLFDLIFFQPLKFLLGFHKLFLLHSSCVAKDSEAVLFPGQSESGKSTLSLSLVRSGFKYLSDDDIILKQRGKYIECLSFLTPVKIKDGLIKYFPEIKNKDLKGVAKGQKNKVDIHRIFPGSFQDKAIPRLIIFPKFNKKSMTRIMPLSKQEAMQRLMTEEFRIFRGQYEHISRRYFRILSKLINQVKTYQLFYKDEDIEKIPGVVEKLL